MFDCIRLRDLNLYLPTKCGAEFELNSGLLLSSYVADKTHTITLLEICEIQDPNTYVT